MKKLFLSVFVFILIAQSAESSNNIRDINEYYKYGQFHRYIKYALKAKEPSLYGKIGKSFFFLQNYGKASKYLLLAYKKSGELDLLNFYTKCQTELLDSITIKKYTNSYIKSKNYDTLALGLYYSIHMKNRLLQNYADSIFESFPSTELSYTAEKHFLYSALSSQKGKPDSLLSNFLSKYNDTYIYNEALIEYSKYLYRNKDRKKLYNILSDTLSSAETRSIVIEHLLELHYYKSTMYKILISALKDSLSTPRFMNEDEWNLRRRQTAIRIRTDLARILLKRRKAKKALFYLKDAEKYRSFFYSAITYNALTDYYKGIALLRTGQYEKARETLADALMESASDREMETKIIRLYKRNFAGSPLTYARKLSKYTGPVFRNDTKIRGLANVSGYRIAASDINNDGYPDLLIDGKLFINKGGLKFTDVTEKAGIQTDYSDRFFFADFNNDGNEDILLANHKSGITIYKNTGDGTFRLVWKDTTILNYSMIAPFNFNGNSYVDFLVANTDKNGDKILSVFINKDSFSFKSRDFSYENANSVNGITIFGGNIYISNSNMNENSFIRFNLKSFKDYATNLHIAGINHDGWWGNSMGANADDIDCDGSPDLVVCNLSNPNNITNSDITKIYTLKNNTYEDMTRSSGIKYDGDNINPVIADFNNDGYNDLFITSRKGSHLYLNRGNGTFTDVTYLSNSRLYNTYGAINIDFDRDGDMDLITCSPDGVKLLENIRDNKNSYFNLKITGKQSGKDAFGTKAILFFNDFKIVKFIHTINGIGNQNDRIIHFGLNLDYGPIKKIKIIFPSGKISYLYHVKRGGVFKINE